jgi:hypothetical protein
MAIKKVRNCVRDDMNMLTKFRRKSIVTSNDRCICHCPIPVLAENCRGHGRKKFPRGGKNEVIAIPCLQGNKFRSETYSRPAVTELANPRD